MMRVIYIFGVVLFAANTAMAAPYSVSQTRLSGRAIRISSRGEDPFLVVCYQPSNSRALVGILADDKFLPVLRAPRLTQSCREIGDLREIVRDRKRLFVRKSQNFYKDTGDEDINNLPEIGDRPSDPRRNDPDVTETPDPTPTNRPGNRPTARPTSTPTPESTPRVRPTATSTPNPTSTPIRPTATPVATATPTAPSIKPIPELAKWESQMLRFGDSLCRTLGDPNVSYDYKLSFTYYDAQWVFQQIADYTRDAKWLQCAQSARSVYRDQYVDPNDGAVPGYWNFTTGLASDYLRSSNQGSKEAVEALSENAAYASDDTPASWTESVDLSREVAYVILSYLNAESVGLPHRPRLELLVNQALGHLDQWFVSKTAPYMRPFMVGLTMQALIAYHEKTGDDRLLPPIIYSLDQMWERTWMPLALAFKYTDRIHVSGGIEPAPDLNLLIAPAYAWVYYKTGLERFRDRGDQIFSGGVTQSFLSNGKQFNQSYRWSFSFVKWRKLLPLK